MRRGGARFGRRGVRGPGTPAGPAATVFGFGSGYNVADLMGTAVGAGPRGSATLGLWCFWGFYVSAVPAAGTTYFTSATAGSNGWDITVVSAVMRFRTNAGLVVSPLRTIVGGDVGKVHAALGFWDPGTLLTELYVDNVRIGTGTAAATFTPDMTGRMALCHRNNGTAPLASGLHMGGFSAGSAALTAGERTQLFADYKATGNIPTVAGKTASLYDIKAAVGGGSAYPATLTDSVGAANMTMYAGSATNLTYTSYSNPTVAY